MKKALSILAVVAIATSFTACKKEYTCTCTGDDTYTPVDLGKQKKADATDACQLIEDSWKTWGDANASCSI